MFAYSATALRLCRNGKYGKRLYLETLRPRNMSDNAWAPPICYFRRSTKKCLARTPKTPRTSRERMEDCSSVDVVTLCSKTRLVTMRCFFPDMFDAWKSFQLGAQMKKTRIRVGRVIGSDDCTFSAASLS